MGTKLHEIHGFLITWPKTSRNVVARGLHTCSRPSNTLLKAGCQIGFNRFQESMDRLLDQYNRESVRNTMLKQEEIFRQQVHELHRLYRVQKMLIFELQGKEVKPSSAKNMTNRATTDARPRFRSSASTSETSHSSYVSNTHHSSAQLNSEYSSLHDSRVAQSAREFSMCSEDLLRVQRSFDLEQPAEECAATDVRAAQDQTRIPGKRAEEKMRTEDLDMSADEECSVELTLSIGGGAAKKKSKHWLHSNIELSCSKPTPSDTRPLLMAAPVRAERGEECSDPSTSCDRESLKKPPWFFQALSLNKT